MLGCEGLVQGVPLLQQDQGRHVERPVVPLLVGISVTCIIVSSSTLIAAVIRCVLQMYRAHVSLQFTFFYKCLFTHIALVLHLCIALMNIMHMVSQILFA